MYARNGGARPLVREAVNWRLEMKEQPAVSEEGCKLEARNGGGGPGVREDVNWRLEMKEQGRGRGRMLIGG